MDIDGLSLNKRKTSSRNFHDEYLTTRRSSKNAKTNSIKQMEKNVQGQRKNISILEDSIKKEIKGHELSNAETRVVVKSFPGATTTCMKDYVKPSLKFKPDKVIIHCGTNDLKKSQSSKEIANSIIELAVDISKEITVCISDLLARNDQFKDKVPEVNSYLKSMCTARNFSYIDNQNVLGTKHLNRSRLHPNRKSTELLSKIFDLSIKN